MTGDQEAPRRRRTTTLRALTIRRAKPVIAPFQARIGPWQKRLAHLRTTRMFHPEQDVRAEAAELLPLILAAQIELEAAVAELADETVARHTSIAAVREALLRLRNELEALQA